MDYLVRLAGTLPTSWVKAVGQSQWRHRWLKRAFDWSADRLRFQDTVIQQGVGRGLRFNAGPSNAGYVLGTSEPEMQAAFAALIDPEMTVYDVGANVGFFSVIAARLVGTEGHVVSFEPVPTNVACLLHNVVLNGFGHVAVRAEAVGREEARARFVVSGVSGWGRLASGGPVNRQVEESIVPARQLDRVIQEAGLPKPDVIKVDVEGAEADVLIGGESTIASARPLLFIELHGTNGPVADLLEKYGYVARVLGSAVCMREAAWNAQIVAVPHERLDGTGSADHFTHLGLPE